MNKPDALKLYDLGYTSLVSVIPPGAPLSPLSKINPSQLGKTPGRKNSSGTWGGYDWLNHVPTRAEVAQWVQDGANIGTRSDYYAVIDADSLNERVSADTVALAHDVLGPAPCRTGRHPKKLLQYRCLEPYARLASIITLPDKSAHLVESFGLKRQHLLLGQHPSGSQYTWDRDITMIPPEELTLITIEKVHEFFEALKDIQESVGRIVERVGDGRIRERAQRSQAELEAPSIAALRECVAAIPNTDTTFPDRDDYIKVGIAIRAAAGPEEEEGYEIFLDWASRWDGGTNDPDLVRSDWRRMRPPFAVGWGWLSDMAKRSGFNAAHYEFGADPLTVVDAHKEAEEAPPEYSDAWLVEQVYKEHGDRIRFVPVNGQFYVWNGSRWQADALLLADHKVGHTLVRLGANLMRQGATEKEKKTNRSRAENLASTHRMREVRARLQTDPRISMLAAAFDADAWSINTPGGIINLRDGSLRAPDPTAMCAKQLAVTPDFEAEPTLWLTCLQEWTGGDKQLEAYLQRLAGYTLSGVTVEQSMHIFWGPGKNGKSVFINTLAAIMSDYAHNAPMDTFTATTYDRHPTDLASLMGARLVTATETQAGRHLDEQRIKSLTGGDPITARFMRGNFFQYSPIFKLWLSGNHRPEIRNMDAAMRRRIHLIPFVWEPQVKDTELKEKLLPFYPGIAAWMVRGCLEWQKAGLAPPPVVIDASNEYFAEEDPYQRFLDECSDENAQGTEFTTDYFREWTEWANSRGEFVGSMRRFSQILATKLTKWQDPVTRRAGFRGRTLRKRNMDETL